MTSNSGLLQDHVHISGGYDDDGNFVDILEYDPEEDSMALVGEMIQARSYHAISVVQAQDYAMWCH